MNHAVREPILDRLGHSLGSAGQAPDTTAERARARAQNEAPGGTATVAGRSARDVVPSSPTSF